MSNTIKIIVICFATYVFLILLHSGLNFSEFETVRDYMRPIARAILFIICIWGLLKLENWAWWLGLVASVFSGGLACYQLIELLISENSQTNILYILQLALLGATLLLAAILLLLPSTRRSIKRSSY